jgi:aspartate/methionine/tyrosine aminotransferase
MSDEIYGLIPHGEVGHESIANHYPEGTIVLGGVSKHLSLGGWRLGVAIVPGTSEGAALLAALRKIAGEVWSSPSAPVQHALIAAYRDDPEIPAYIAECARIHAIRTHRMWECLSELGIPCCKPEGGFYLFPNFDHLREPLAKRGIKTSFQLTDYLLEKYAIATLPGAQIGTPAEDLSVRLATSYLDMETHEHAAAVLAAYRANPDPAALMRDHHPMTQAAMDQFRRFVREL